MKVGDLVVLSAYAKKLKNYYNGREDDVGLICAQHWHGAYAVRWASDGFKNIHVDRRDIIYAKIT